MQADLAYYLAASAAVILFGLSKGGFSGISMMAMPLFAMVISPIRAAAILLPIMIVQDWVSVWAFRRDFSPRNLVILLPAALVGVALGWALAAYVNEAWVKLAVGLISLLFVVFMILPERWRAAGSARPKVVPGFIWGSIAGFTSMVSHAGGIPFLVYVVPQKLLPTHLAGTAALFFAGVNLLKVMPYFLLGQFTLENLRASAMLLPIAIFSTFAGVWLIHRIAPDKFYSAIYVLTMLIGLKLTWDAGWALWG
jgi:uncharacterized membrane protein YfcA